MPDHAHILGEESRWLPKGTLHYRLVSKYTIKGGDGKLTVRRCAQFRRTLR